MSRVCLKVGASLLTNAGIVRVENLRRDGVLAVCPGGTEQFVTYADLQANSMLGDQIQATHVSLSPWWEGLSEAVRAEALFRMQTVIELLTGFQSGHAGTAAPGEPFFPFGPGFKVSELEKRAAMSDQLKRQGRSVSASTVYNWIRAWERDGLRGLVDGRKSRKVQDFDRLPASFRAAAEAELAGFTGDVSAVSISEVRRRIWVRLKDSGLAREAVPDRFANEYLSLRFKSLGQTTRGQKSARVRQRAGYASFPAMHPSHVCMDVTRADNLVFDEVRGEPYSVEIITVLSVSTRVVLACRVVPRSASAIEAGLALYDTMRPFSMLVEDTSVDDWRWAGLPQSIRATITTPEPPATLANQRADLQGRHWVPSVAPTSVRTDHGSIFVSSHLQALLRDFGVDFLPSRVGASTDNAFVERWHETLQRGLQQRPL